MSSYINIHTHYGEKKAIVNKYPFDPIDSHPFSIGLHPLFFDRPECQIIEIERKAALFNCYAIGESGYDSRSEFNKEDQDIYFKKQLAIAKKHEKPVIVHCVKSHHILLKTLLATDKLPAIILHGFNQKETIYNTLKPHCYFSFGKALLYKNSNAQKTIKQIALDKIFLETDDSTEITIEEIYLKASKLLNLPLEKLILQIHNNFKNVFHAEL
ncbi:TatD family hydrolase [Flavobacteriaceae bacterium]|nr:TatD family hydrolase [Flavobacteriaceae bacterium]